MKTFYKIQYWDANAEAWKDTQNQYDLRQEAETACEYLEAQCPAPHVFFRIQRVTEEGLQEIRQHEFAL